MPEKAIDTTQTSDQLAALPSAGPEEKRYIDREIPIELIDEPSLPERETMDEVALADLALDIMAIGLTNPITVFERGGRFETIAGHRRLLACRLAGLAVVPCRVRTGDEVDPVAILVSENAEREKVNPVHQARFFERLLAERCGGDVDRLCVLVRRRREYVEGRLLLLMGHPKVTEAVEKGQIKLAVAAELNRIQDPARMVLLLDVAVQSGATARQVAQWAQEGAVLGPIHVDGAAAGDTPPLPIVITPTNPMQCVLCEGEEYPHLMEMLWVHGPCRTILNRMLNRLPALPPEREY